MGKWRTGGWIACVCLLLADSLFSSTSTTPIEVPRAEKPPVLDGKLDDPVWQSALRMADFKTWQPDYGKEPRQKTEAYLLYDAENFYVAFRCYDTEPNKIKGSISKRDTMFSDDYAGVLLDMFNDKQTSYGFMMNPLGIQGDGIVNADGNLDEKLDMVWYSKGQIDDQGYAVECRIPLQSIRFPGKQTIIIGVFFFRQFVRYSEMASAPAWTPDRGSVLSQSQPVSVSGLKYKRVIEILPAVTYADRLSIQDGRLRRDEKWTDFSLTAKVGLTSDIVTNATYNPDFSQVESDAGQVDFNVRYALYYPEKRPFFLEGMDSFRFAGNTEEAPLVAVVYTRNIIDPVFGLNLTGKVGSKNTIAAIYARDELPDDPVDTRPDFAIVRYKRTFTQDNYIGGFYTAKEFGGGFNRVAGLDGRIRLSQVSFGEYHLFGSFTRASVNTSMSDGHALGLRYAYFSQTVNLDVGYQDISPDFRVDTGFVTRTGLRNLAFFAMYTIFPKSKFFQRIEPLYWSYHLYDTSYKTFETINLLTLRFRFPRSSELRVDTILGNEVYVGQKFSRSGFGFQGFSQMTKQFYLEGFYRRSGAIFYDPEASYQGYGNRAYALVQYQPGEKFDFILSLTYIDFYRQSDKQKIYNYAIIRNRNTFQVNKYLFLRAIFEYNNFYKRLVVDGLVSFTYIPGTVLYLGYGSAFERSEWTGTEYIPSTSFMETQRGFFFKVSYLWRW
jgi:hypothetical protein